MTTTLPSTPIGGEMSTDSNIASDVGQQATESNNHPERVGNFARMRWGRRGNNRENNSMTTTNNDNDDDKINNDNDDDKITINYMVDY
jgi:hypothetical protein